MNKALSFDDVLLEPQFSDIGSRGVIDISNELSGEMRLSLPVISSPMDTVTEAAMAIAMNYNGGIGIIHRYNTIDEQVSLVLSAGIQNIGAAVGASGDFLERATALVNAGTGVICVDVAHGHHVLMRNALQVLRGGLRPGVHIMAGNVATLEGFNDLADWGADSIRVGIGGGSICSTRVQTGHGVPTFQSVLDCAKSDRDAKLIADGGIRTNGDIVKALAAGADFVMLGSLLAGTDESPGEMFTNDKKKYKVYRGMASSNAQKDWRGKTSAPEGISTTIPYKGSVKQILSDMTGNIQSGFSYSGARSMQELWFNSNFIKQTSAGQFESSTHILRNK